MTTTDTIKALRDALTEAGQSIPDHWSLHKKIRHVLALTADASEDAPEVVRHIQLIGGGRLKREDRDDGSHGWLVYGDDNRLLFALNRRDQCFVDSALAARPAPTTAAPNTSKNRVETPETRMDTHSHGGAELARPAPVAATPAYAELTDADIDTIWQTMPGGPAGWLKSFGYNQFAREIEAAIMDGAAAPAAPVADTVPANPRTPVADAGGAVEAWPLWCEACGADRSKEFCNKEHWQACKFIGTAYAAEQAKPEPKFTPGNVAAHHQGENESNQALSIETGQVDHQQVATPAPGVAHANLVEGAKPWQDRMGEHYAKGNVLCHPDTYFMAQEIEDWRGQQAGAVDGEGI